MYLVVIVLFISKQGTYFGPVAHKLLAIDEQNALK
jgi:hypothetical protein